MYHAEDQQGLVPPERITRLGYQAYPAGREARLSAGFLRGGLNGGQLRRNFKQVPKQRRCEAERPAGAFRVYTFIRVVCPNVTDLPDVVEHVAKCLSDQPLLDQRRAAAPRTGQ